MLSPRPLTTFALVAFLALAVTGCAQMPKADPHAGHQAAADAPAGKPAAHGHMKAMREMHDKMAAARTPAERQALMAEHMKTMREGMQSMKGMGGKSSDMHQRHPTMEERMDMMQTMMEMMMQRLPDAAAPAHH